MTETETLPGPESKELTFPAPDPIQAMLDKPWIDQMNPKTYALWKATKGDKLNDAEVAMALEMARSMGLNPWANEFYASKSKNGKLLLMVGRDGLLRKAEEFPDYAGYDADVVHENDNFERREPDPDARTLRQRAGVVHTYGHPKQRGPVVGAWAVAERRGRPPRFFFADFDEYRPSEPKDGSSWKSNPTVMIEKVPISVVHRTLCNLSGVYLPEEVERALETDARGPRPDDTQAILQIVEELETDAETRSRLVDGIQRLNELSPGSWGLGKAQMTLPGRSHEELVRQAEQIEADIRAEEARATPAPAEEVQDAVVVDDDGVIQEDEAAVLRENIADLRAILETDVDPDEAAAVEAELDAKQERLHAIEDAATDAS